jgi:subtilisin family serine protease
VAEGILFAVSVGARVINLSFAADQSSPAVADALYAAETAGCTVVCAAGNEALNAVQSIAASSTTLAVGATDGTDRIAAFSNFGSGVDVYAPGVALNGAFGSPSDTADVQWSGTSFSTGFASAAAALVVQRHPTWGPSSVRSAVRTQTDPVLDANGRAIQGAGRVNLLKAASR